MGICFIFFTIFLVTISYLPTADGQLESISIDGPERVLYNSVFSFYVDVVGVSRASYGDFSVNIAILEKESGMIVVESPGYLLSGKNTFLFSGKEYGTSKNLVTLKPDVPHVFRIQYLLNTWEFDFLPVSTVDDLNIEREESIKDTIETEPTKEDLMEEDVSAPKRIGGAYIDWIETSSIEGRYIPFIEVCAGSQRLVSPELLITSDSEELPIEIGFVISANSCRQYNYAKIRADDINSITVQLVEKTGESVDNLKEEVKELKEEVVELKEQIEKKDGVLMEQLRVIQQLVASFKNTIFEPISKFFGFA